MGMGVIERKNAAGETVYYAQFFDQAGKRRRESCGTDKKLAEDVYHLRKLQKREGHFFPERRTQTLTQAIDAYVNDRKLAVKRSKDLIRYGEFWKAKLGAPKMRGLQSETVAAVVQKLRAADLGQQTISHYVSFLRRVFKRAIEDGYCERNPVRSVPPPKHGRVRYLTDDEEHALMAKLPAHARPAVEFAILTGARQSEQFGLEWRHVDLERGIARLPQGKNKDPRIIRLNAEAKTILRRLRKRHMRSRFVFNNERGTKLNPHNFMARRFVPAILAAGIEDFRWHDLRHTFASRLAMTGESLSVIGALLGHKSPQMTARYTHLSAEHLDAAVAKARLARATKTANARRA